MCQATVRFQGLVFPRVTERERSDMRRPGHHAGLQGCPGDEDPDAMLKGEANQAGAVIRSWANPPGQVRVAGFLAVALSLFACTPAPFPAAPSGPTSPPVSSPSALPPADTQHALQMASRILAGGLRLEESALMREPDLDPLSFLPAEGTQEQILARHAVQRRATFPDRSSFDEGNPSLWAPWRDGTLVAELATASGDPPQQTVELRYGEQVLFSAPAGLPSPALPLQGLWTFDGHWALEILMATPDVWAGRIFEDGEPVNEELGCEDAFGFQLLAGTPFYFCQRQGLIAAVYDGQAIDLHYSQIPHYRCCSESVLNPRQAEEMVSFFAVRDGAWYYVEIGAFD